MYRIQDQKGPEAEMSKVRGTMDIQGGKNIKEKDWKTKQGPVREALVCWLGYDESYDSWEPMSVLDTFRHA